MRHLSRALRRGHVPDATPCGVECELPYPGQKPPHHSRLGSVLTRVVQTTMPCPKESPACHSGSQRLHHDDQQLCDAEGPCMGSEMQRSPVIFFLCIYIGAVVY